ncbi:hypothetical protein BJ928_1242 [Rhizobium sp. WW_1]|jgi:hypothetical protein|nr:hypothetical protein BJ928_1242 [Rhizobium sp. WW_1]
MQLPERYCSFGYCSVDDADPKSLPGGPAFSAVTPSVEAYKVHSNKICDCS